MNRIRKAISAGMLIISVLASVVGVGLAATPTPTPTPTRTPAARPAATRAPLVNALRKQLVFGTETFDLRLFDGVLPGCPTWDELAPKVKQDPQLPYVHNAGFKNDVGQFCIYGLFPDNGLTVELTRPDGSQVEPAQLRSESLGSFASLIQNQPFAEITSGYSLPSDPAAFTLYLWLPAGLPGGKWSLFATNPDGAEARSEFKVKTSQPLPAIGLTKPHVGSYGASTSPFNLPQVDRNCYPYSPGSTVTIYAVNLLAQTDYQLGVYRLNPAKDTQLDLVDTLAFKTNKKGNSQIELALKSNLETGTYRILLPTVPGAKKYWEAGPSVCVEVQ